MNNFRLGTICLALFSGAHAQEFDRSMLEGVWAESTNYQFGCRPDNLNKRQELSSDGKTLTYKRDIA